MSPDLQCISEALGRFPRVSGDEPYKLKTSGEPVTFSPRERG